MSAHVFISYSSTDKIRTEVVLKELESAGFPCWIAPRDIEPGHSYGSDIVQAIANATAVLLIFSEHSQQSPWVLKEVERAISKGIPVIPFRIENCIPTGEMEFFISNTQWIDAFGNQWNAALTTLKRTIQTKLNPVKPVAKSHTISEPTNPAPLVKTDDVKIQPPTLIIPQSKDPNTVTDIDGNVYKTVKIGNQIWTAENLKVTSFNDGTPIPNVASENQWVSVSKPAYCWNDNLTSNKNKYGGLYNFFAINSGRLAPKGWHVPTDKEWELFVIELGGHQRAQKQLKKSLHQLIGGNLSENQAAGYLLGGRRSGMSGKFEERPGFNGYWWSSVALNHCDASFWYTMEKSVGHNYYSKQNGFSVLLVQN